MIAAPIAVSVDTAATTTDIPATVGSVNDVIQVELSNITAVCAAVPVTVETVDESTQIELSVATTHSPIIPVTVEAFEEAIQIELSAEYQIYPPYDGPYEFTPSLEAQTVHTAGNYMKQDIVVDPIPSNYGLITWNGSTLTVS